MRGLGSEAAEAVVADFQATPNVAFQASAGRANATAADASDASVASARVAFACADADAVAFAAAVAVAAAAAVGLPPVQPPKLKCCLFGARLLLYTSR